MTIKNLMYLLSKYPPDMEVLSYDYQTNEQYEVGMVPAILSKPEASMLPIPEGLTKDQQREMYGRELPDGHTNLKTKDIQTWRIEELLEYEAKLKHVTFYKKEPKYIGKKLAFVLMVGPAVVWRTLSGEFYKKGIELGRHTLLGSTFKDEAKK